MTAADRPRVLFVCVGNAGRSQIAAAWLAHLAGDRVAVRSAGTSPAAALNPLAVAVMAEVGIGISAATPQALTDDALAAADVVVVVGPDVACRVPPGVRHEIWAIADLPGLDIVGVRAIRDAIRARVGTLLRDQPIN